MDQPVGVQGERGAAAEAEFKPPSSILIRPAVTPIREWASKVVLLVQYLVVT